MNFEFDWDNEKNRILISLRGISFEEVISVIESGDIIDILAHPNQQQYPHQKMYVIEINDYVYLVPFAQNKNKIFLKTIIPSQKATKKYLR